AGDEVVGLHGGIAVELGNLVTERPDRAVMDSSLQAGDPGIGSECNAGVDGAISVASAVATIEPHRREPIGKGARALLTGKQIDNCDFVAVGLRFAACKKLADFSMKLRRYGLIGI